MEIKIDKLFSYILVICIPCYFLQGTLYESGSIISQTLVLAWILIDLYFALKYLLQPYRDHVGNIILLFSTIIFLSWLFSPKFVTGISTLRDLKNILVAFLTYFPFSKIFRHNLLEKKLIVIFLLVLFVAFILSYFNTQLQVMEMVGHNVLGITNNSSYNFVLILPMLYILLPKNKCLLGILLLIVLFFVIQGAKRGAIICLAVQLLFLVTYSIRVSKKNIIYKFLKLLLVLTVIAAVSYTFYSSNEYLHYRLDSMLEGTDASGDARLHQYSSIYAAATNGGLLRFLFGYGFNQTLNIAGNYAHNDWLELLANSGVFGVFVYFTFFVVLLSSYGTKRKYLSLEDRLIFKASFATWIIRSMFSMSYLYMETFMLIISYAYIQTKLNCANRITHNINN